MSQRYDKGSSDHQEEVVVVETKHTRGTRTTHRTSRTTPRKVVHIRRDPYDLYIGRGSIWGNPFKIGPDGGRGEVLAKYKEYLLRGELKEGRHLLKRIGELEGKTLGCYCAPHGGLTIQDETRCHGQMLLQLVRIRERREEAA